MQGYKATEVEKKWQKKWQDLGLYNIDLGSDKKPKYYNLVMFPYPSGDKLHVGHWYNYGPADSHGRFMRMQGYNVFQPMGYDSFGLPAENYAIKTGTPPQESTDGNTGRMTEQLSAMGAMWDWDKTVSTSQPDYYKWTQWVFLDLYKKGLAYKKEAPVNWCPSCQTVLANEQVKDGHCDRCSTEVVQKDLSQWFFAIKDYAEDLLNHDKIDWPEKTKLMQKNWIGKSKGITYKQKVKDCDIEFEAYDSVPQSFMAQTFAVIAPEHPKLAEMVKGTEHEQEVMKFVEDIKKKKAADRFNIETDLEGVFTGRYVDNPFGTGDLPIWVASFVVADYGSGIVNCSAHDERDFAFAKKYDIELRPVMFPPDEKEAEKVKNLEYCYHHDPEAILMEPKEFEGRAWGEVREDILDYLEKNNIGVRTTNYKLRDWLISRQRYWGAPIPIVYDPEGNAHEVPEEHLPWMLPTDVDYNPKGKSPLASSKDFFERTEEVFGKGWTPEVDTMDTFMCSSWYFLRYLSPEDEGQAYNMDLVKKWMPVDMYIGGPEHACMHLLYARFIHKALMDDRSAEPFARLVHQGLVTKDGAKMSKSKGNVVSPDEFIEKYGTDTFRMYLMFMGPFTDGGDWNDKGITGIARFVERFWRLINQDFATIQDQDALEKMVHKTIKKVTEDVKKFHFNTAVAALMEFVNFGTQNGIDQDNKKKIVQLIAPLAPHLAEECWDLLGEKESIFDSQWPEFNAKLVVDDVLRIGVQVNGKVRGDIEISKDASEEDAVALAKEQPNISKYLEEGEIKKIIYVPGKILGLVVR